MVLNFVASANGVGDVGTRLLLPWILCAALIVSLSGDEELDSSSSSSESLSASDGEYGGGGAVSSRAGCCRKDWCVRSASSFMQSWASGSISRDVDVARLMQSPRWTDI